jgi:hypothetical protein
MEMEKQKLQNKLKIELELLVKRKLYFFIFQEKSKAEKLRDLYWSKNGIISPKLYAEGIRSLKERIFANERSQNGST